MTPPPTQQYPQLIPINCCCKRGGGMYTAAVKSCKGVLCFSLDLICFAEFNLILKLEVLCTQI